MFPFATRGGEEKHSPATSSPTYMTTYKRNMFEHVESSARGQDDSWLMDGFVTNLWRIVTQETWRTK